jgi:hypothetical protein
LTLAEFSIENLKVQLNDSNSKLSNIMSDFDSIVQHNVKLQTFLEESEIRLEHATAHVQELIVDRTCLQHENSQLKINMHEIQALRVSLEGKFQVCDRCHLFIEQLTLEKGALVQDLEELEFSAQRQVDSWQSIATNAKTEAHDLSTRVDNLMHENRLLLLSLENKVRCLP